MARVSQDAKIDRSICPVDLKIFGRISRFSVISLFFLVNCNKAFWPPSPDYLSAQVFSQMFSIKDSLLFVFYCSLSGTHGLCT